MKHLTSEERHTIEKLLEQNFSQAEIARILNRSKSTISREIMRNCDQRNSNYRSKLAQDKAQKRKSEKPVKHSVKGAIKTFIIENLNNKLSPEQIVGIATKQNLKFVSIECIYQYIWKDKHQGGNLYEHLRNRGKRDRKRGSSKDSRGIIKNRTPISERPKVVEERTRLGDLEIDLVIGKNHKGALLTINDRASGLLYMEKLQGKTSEEVSRKTVERLLNISKQIHTITSDNGKEFADHEYIAKKLDVDFYFAKPHHSWERGSNENLNGLVRQYIPKNSDISKLSNSYIKYVENELNNRPRKRYNYDSPNEKHKQLAT